MSIKAHLEDDDNGKDENIISRSHALVQPRSRVIGIFRCLLRVPPFRIDNQQQ